MRLWKRASAALKDKTSLWQANLTRRTPLRNPDIDKAVIRATSHRDSPLDRRNIERVCQWLRLSPLNLKPILSSISSRMEKTRDWSVALKGLLLTHALITCKTPAVTKIGRLPFDLSAFKHAHASPPKAWPFNAFVRAYYAFLDQKSATLFLLAEEDNHLDLGGGAFVMRRELAILQKLQLLADLLLEIKPAATAAFVPLVLDVMDGVIVEIYEVYSRICRGIAMVLMNIYTAGKAEAATALRVVQKATQQGDHLSYFFEFCREIGVMNASEAPVIDRIPEEGIQELEQIIEGFDYSKGSRVIVVREAEEKRDELKTIITDEWERFDEDFVGSFATGSSVEITKNQEPPDLITFL